MSVHDHYTPTRDEVLAAAATPLPKALGTVSVVLAAIGAIAFVAGAIIAPDRAWRAFHANWLFWAGVSSAGVTFVAVQRITTARWSRSIVRFLEAYVAFLPIALVFLLLTLTVGAGHVFPWMVESPPVPEKALYFNRAFFSARVLLTFALITALSLWYIYNSVRLDTAQIPEAGSHWAAGWRARMRRDWRDERREIHSTHSLQGKLAVLLALLYGFGWSVLSWDLSMGLSLHFQSTLYSWWFFMGSWVAALALWTLLTLAWRRRIDPAHRLVTEQHFHDLGKLVFAFTCFWGYLTFGQYLVIWYGNLGEETHWPRLRLVEPWLPVTLTAVTLTFAFPFFGLMSRAAKLFKPTLVLFAAASVVGIWLVRYLEVYPSRYGEIDYLPFGIWEIGVAMLYAGVWGISYLAFMNAFPRIRVTLLTSPFRDEVQVPVDPETMEPLPAHE